MKLIDNFLEKFHNYSLPSPEKCFVLEEWDEIYINKWIKNGKINGKMKERFEWIEKNMYLIKSTFLAKEENNYEIFLQNCQLVSFSSFLVSSSRININAPNEKASEIINVSRK